MSLLLARSLLRASRHYETGIRAALCPCLQFLYLGFIDLQLAVISLAHDFP